MDVHFSSDGRWLASASNDGTVKLWNGNQLSETQNGQVLLPENARREIPRIAFSPDSQRVASGDGISDVVVMDVETRTVRLRLQGHRDVVICVAFSRDGRFIASGGMDSTVRLWDARTGKLLRTLLGHEGTVSTLAFTPDSRLLASGSHDNTIKLWRLPSPRE